MQELLAYDTDIFQSDNKSLRLKKFIAKIFLNIFGSNQLCSKHSHEYLGSRI